MSRFLSKLFLLLALSAIFLSCGFIDPRPIEYSIEPDGPDAFLSGAFSPVIIRFDAEMIKDEAEKIPQVTSGAGVIRGDFSWEENDLYFTPIQGWTAGIRYTAGFSGTARSVDGRELRLARYVSFYAINRSQPPLLEEHYPADGASVGTGDASLEFYFSQPMDRLTVEYALTTEGISDKTFEWSLDDKKLKVNVTGALSPWTSYRWNIKDSAKSKDGAPLPRTYSGHFTTNLDQNPPRVTGVFPVTRSNGSWYPTGADAKTGLASGQGIAVEFSKPMGDNVLRSVRFEPALAGKTETLSENSVVYIFSKDPDGDTTYTLIISAETKDSEGLKIGEEYRINITPDIPFLRVLSFSKDSVSIIENLSSNALLPVRVEAGMGEVFFSIRFSTGFTLEEKQNTARRIALSVFFPGILAPVALQYAAWISDDRLYARWEGLTAGSAQTPHYYKLTIPGGKNGINNGAGMYMKEDFTIYLEAIDGN